MSTQLLMIVLIILGGMILGTLIGLIIVARQKINLQEQIDELKENGNKKRPKRKRVRKSDKVIELSDSKKKKKKRKSRD